MPVNEFISRNRLLFLLLAIGLLAFWNAPLGQYCYDDTTLISDCHAIESWSNLPKLISPQFGPAFGDLHYRPVAPLTFFIDAIVFHKNSFSSRLINLALHLSIGLLLFILWRRLFRREPVAFLAAAIFLCHPIVTEVVDCPGFRKDLLSTLLTLCSLYLLLGFVTRWTLWRACAAAAVWLVGLLAKEPTVMLLLLAPMVFLHSQEVRETWRPFNNAKKRRTILALAAFALAFAIFLPLYLRLSYRTPVQNPMGDYKTQILKENPTATAGLTGTGAIGKNSSPSTPTAKPLLGFLNFTRTFHLYSQLWLVPVGLSNGHYFVESTSYNDSRLWVGLAVLIVFASLSLFAYTGCGPFLKSESTITPCRLAGIGGMWVCISLLPIAQILPTPQILAERYVYMAHAGMALVFAAGLTQARDSFVQTRRGGWMWSALVAALLLTYIALTINRNRDWYDDVTLNIRRYEQWDNAQGKLALGSLYYSKGDRRKAAFNFQEAIRRDPNMADAQRGMGVLYMEIKKYKEARSHFIKARQLDPKNEKTRQALDVLSKLESSPPAN